MKWFKHDSNASSDAKLEKLRIKYGMSGYGLYWYCLELISGSVEPHNITFELEHDAEIISHRTGINIDLVSEMMTMMCNLGLFENNQGVITCLKMRSRTDDYIGRIVNSKLRSDSEHTPNKVVVNRIEENTIEENIINKPSRKVNGVPYSEIVNLYHTILPSLPKVEKLTATRKAQIRQRWTQDLTEIGHWENYFDYVKQSKFLMGQVAATNGHKVFRANLEWLTKESNFVKISEENYHGNI